MHESGGQNSEIQKKPLTKKQIFYLVLGIILTLALTIGNVAVLICHRNTYQAYRKLKDSIDLTQLQIKYVEDCQSLSEYIPQLTPPLVHYQDENGQEYLYYCTNVSVEEPASDALPNRWPVRSTPTTYATETVTLPNYKEIGEQTYYHPYYTIDSQNTVEYYLETYHILQINDFYHVIKSKYKRVPSTVDIDDSDSITEFLAGEDLPRAEVSRINLPQASPDNITIINFDDESVINLDPPETCCGCTGCCCENCTCTG